MLRLEQANWVALGIALVAATLLGGPQWTAEEQQNNGRLPSVGHDEIRDAMGRVVPTANYSRIVSFSSIADQVLLEIVDPRRWVAVSERARQSPYAHRVALKHSVSDGVDLEQLLLLQPDIIFAHLLGGKEHLEGLRAHGVQVFYLGPMRGLGTLLPNIEAIGSVIDEAQRAKTLARNFEERLRRVHGGKPPLARALYLGVHGGSIFGGTKGTSFHDVLIHAGLMDVAAADYEGWPRYTPEQVLTLDPDVVVSHEEGKQRLCSDSILSQARACRQPGAVLTVPRALLNDPGLLMLDATEELRRQLDAMRSRR